MTTLRLLRLNKGLSSGLGRSSLLAALALVYVCATAIYADHSPQPTGRAPSYSDQAFQIQMSSANTKFDVLTQHNDLARTGAASHEDILTPDNLRSGQFGFLGSVPLEGKIYAQPLYVEKAAVLCSNEGATSVTNANIAYVATLENYIYAIDVDAQQVCWKTPQLGVPQPGGGLNGIDPQGEGAVRVGILSTPAIDLQKSVIYAATRIRNANNTGARIFLNSIDTRTGALIATAEVLSRWHGRLRRPPFQSVRSQQPRRASPRRQQDLPCLWCHHRRGRPSGLPRLRNRF